VHPTTTGAVTETFKALLVAMDRWVEQGIEPPRSNYPTPRNGTAVPLEVARVMFPDIPGVQFPTVLNEYELLDFGPEFGEEGGVLTLQPPLLGPRYASFVPAVNADGLEIGGVRPMQIRVPLGTSAGWNIRRPEFRAPDVCGLTGSFIPFANTTAERLASDDPRLSLEERYGDHQGFVRAVRRAARQLMNQGFLLLEDAEAFIAAAEASDVLK
jgi:Alpha/beta hydrolase domain